jgi:DNA polymerase-3 subunit delta
MSGGPPNDMFYIFHGDDVHSQIETLAGLQRQLGDPDLLALNTARFDGRKVSLSELQHVCDSVPFLSKRRLVIVEDLIKNKPAFLDELVEYLAHLPETTSLVFLESGSIPANNRIVQLAQSSEMGYVKLHILLEGNQLERWVRQRVKSAGGRISPRAAHLLVANVGSNLVLMANEIEKLVLYTGEGVVEPEDVEKLCTYVAEASVFELVDAVGNRHGKKAARLLHNKLAEGTDPARLFAMIVRQFRLLIQVKELAVAGRKPPDIAQKLHLHSFVTGKVYQQSANFSQPQLEQIYAHLLEMDVGVKTGRRNMLTALDLFIAGVAT